MLVSLSMRSLENEGMNDTMWLHLIRYFSLLEDDIRLRPDGFWSLSHVALAAAATFREFRQIHEQVVAQGNRPPRVMHNAASLLQGSFGAVSA
jgi:hypothetical protein